MRKVYEHLSRREFLIKFFGLWNTLLTDDYTLTKKELQFLVEVLMLPEKFKYSRFSTAARKYLVKQFDYAGWKLSPQGFSRVIDSLSKKGILVTDEDGVIDVHHSLKKVIDNNRKEYTFFVGFRLKEEE
jgi:hypothetical protein